mmetsp:Transcript_14792/g.21138  ORF Transcript_14792/g.21138 Transcript_14792/m.21138 type:complete len:225 (+) Transcript_14792:390-1064(+)|eukprot:CAMPEP_0184864450 /NCGR_PEP_ID=MMETSP0580-20130426/14989_1 /TAXON_ID=1118495 /ORGANISM="Dactyliosolen fragilissimus" /LENGTH=224 /DNA_ID=CAMNT_0027363245 /DNA_START=296 /DNA_END=970 /DNA_ORIENTATION=-
MGNESSSNGMNRMAISAVANMMKITKSEMIDLRDRCMQYVDTYEDPAYFSVNREDFRSVLDHLEVDELDRDIFDELFTMWEKTGDHQVHPILFLTSASPLASTMDVSTKLKFAFQMFDINETGRVTYKDMERILGGLNATASYFGDSVVTPQQIDVLVRDIFDSETTFASTASSYSQSSYSQSSSGREVYYMDRIQEMAMHPIVRKFASGEGTMRYSVKISIDD